MMQNNFLLSSSMDKTVRLWHISRSECLCCFNHSDFVTSIQFHPRDDRFFIAGSLDTKLRLWSIPDKSVAFVTAVSDMITAVAFSPDGRYCMAGCLNGTCYFYETERLKAAGYILVRSARGRNSKGSKITGIDTMSMPPGVSSGETKLLITSNDSRIRLYNFRDRTLEAKYRGNENTCSQIRATFSDDGKHIICGSEDRRTYIWPVKQAEKDSDKRAFEVFDTRTPMVTAAVMSPARTKQTLGFSEDPIYDICNPPPVTLADPSDAGSLSKQGSMNGETRKNRNSGLSKLAQESPGYISRSTHPDGNIIVVADYSGKIKILRQDCAYQKRRFENWDSTMNISRRLLAGSNSARRSIASSIGKESSHKTPSERIISWRNSVIRHDQGSKSSRNASPTGGAVSRYSSPARNSSGALVEEPAKSSFDSRSPRNSGDAAPRKRDSDIVGDIPRSATAFIASGKDKENPLWLRGDHSYAYWNKLAHDAIAANTKNNNNTKNATSETKPPDTSPPHLLDPNTVPGAGERKNSVASALSSDYGSSNPEGDESEVLKCDECGSTNFQGVKGRKGKQRLVCVRCSRPIS